MDRLIKTVQNFPGFFCRNADAGQRSGGGKTHDDFPPGKSHHPDKGLCIQRIVVGNDKPLRRKAKRQCQPFTLCRGNLPGQGNGHTPSCFHSQDFGCFAFIPEKGSAFLQPALCQFRQLTGRHIRLPFLPQRLTAVSIPHQKTGFVQSAVYTQQV